MHDMPNAWIGCNCGIARMENPERGCLLMLVLFT